MNGFSKSTKNTMFCEQIIEDSLDVIITLTCEFNVPFSFWMVNAVLLGISYKASYPSSKTFCPVFVIWLQREKNCMRFF